MPETPAAPPAARRLTTAVLAAALVLASALPAYAQPTFGRPREDRPRPVQREGVNDIPLAPEAAASTNDWIEQDPPRLEPSPDAPPGVWHTARTSEGYRYAWSLPADFAKGQARNMVVILHPQARDFRWGMLAHARAAPGNEGSLPPGTRVFRPRDIVISLDGLSPVEGSRRLRSFEPSTESFIRLRDVILELSRTFPTQRIYVYGMQQGGAFAAGFSAAFPALTDGLIVHGAEVPEKAIAGGTVPVVILHGAKDQRTPLAAAFEAFSAYREAGREHVYLRVIRNYNDFPSPARVDEAIELLDALRTTEPADALASARRLLVPRPPDEYDFRAPVWYAGAMVALRRAAGDAGPEFESVPDAEVLTGAKALMKLIDDEGQAHVDALKPLVSAGDAGALALDGGAWIGYAAALRDDFRGVPSVEAYFASLGFDALLDEHAKAARELIDVWTGEDTPDPEKFAKAVAALPACYLFEALPVDLPTRARAIARKARELGIPDDQRDRAEYITLYDRGWRDGLQAYASRWQRWRFNETP
jgi:hypothetical protein